MRHFCVYKMLKSHGHAPVKAAEIILDASRGDEYALLWIKTMFKARRS